MNAIGFGLCVIGAGFGIGFAGANVAQAMARQPEVEKKLFTVFVMAASFVEALAIIGFVVALVS